MPSVRFFGRDDSGSRRPPESETQGMRSIRSILMAGMATGCLIGSANAQDDDLIPAPPPGLKAPSVVQDLMPRQPPKRDDVQRVQALMPARKPTRITSGALPVMTEEMAASVAKLPEPLMAPEATPSLWRMPWDSTIEWDQGNADASRRGSTAFIEWIYWVTEDSPSTGNLYDENQSFQNGGTFRDIFNTGRINTNYEMGFRAGVRRQMSDILSGELLGFWLHPYEFPGGYLTPNAADQLTFLPSGERLEEVVFLFRQQTHGIEANGRWLLWNQSRFALDGIAGLRYLQHSEFFGQRYTDIAGVTNDERFRVQNDLFGPQLGFDARYCIAPYTMVRMGLKTILATNMADFSVRGDIPDGLLARQSNIGFHQDSRFSAGLEWQLGMVFRVTPNFSVHGTYDFLWFENVGRVMNNVDLLELNNRDPLLARRYTDMWLQGLSVRFEYHY
jgi:hypothetical protein